MDHLSTGTGVNMEKFQRRQPMIQPPATQMAATRGLRSALIWALIALIILDILGYINVDDHAHDDDDEDYGDYGGHHHHRHHHRHHYRHHRRHHHYYDRKKRDISLLDDAAPPASSFIIGAEGALRRIPFYYSTELDSSSTTTTTTTTTGSPMGTSSFKRSTSTSTSTTYTPLNGMGSVGNKYTSGRKTIPSKWLGLDKLSPEYARLKRVACSLDRINPKQIIKIEELVVAESGYSLSQNPVILCNKARVKQMDSKGGTSSSDPLTDLRRPDYNKLKSACNLTDKWIEFEKCILERLRSDNEYNIYQSLLNKASNILSSSS